MSTREQEGRSSLGLAAESSAKLARLDSPLPGVVFESLDSPLDPFFLFFELFDLIGNRRRRVPAIQLPGGGARRLPRIELLQVMNLLVDFFQIRPQLLQFSAQAGNFGPVRAALRVAALRRLRFRLLTDDRDAAVQAGNLVIRPNFLRFLGVFVRRFRWSRRCLACAGRWTRPRTLRGRSPGAGRLRVDAKRRAEKRG